jgi:alcohol dehydrogenase
MKALAFHGPDRYSWADAPDPALFDQSDAIVRVDATTICGTDLHILRGDVPGVSDGRILGHEGTGTVAEIGAAVRGVAPGDRVLISCISPCGRCPHCRGAADRPCTRGGGWGVGPRIGGTHAG